MSSKWAQFEDPCEANGYAQISNALLRHPGISLQAKGFYALLKSYAWQDPSTFPGIKRLRADTGSSDNTLKKYRQELIDVGLLEVRRQGQGKTNLYIFKSLNKFLRGESERSESHTGAKQESHTGASPEPNTGANYEDAVDEDAVDNSRRESDDSQQTEKTPEQINWFDVYAERCKDYGFAVSDEDRNRHAGNLRRLVMLESATHAEMNRVIGKILDDKTRGYIISPQEALNKVRGIPRGERQAEARAPQYKDLN